MAQKQPKDDTPPNLAVRLDQETKNMLSIFSISLGISEKEIAIEAIQGWMRTRIDSVAAKFNEVAKAFQQKGKK